MFFFTYTGFLLSIAYVAFATYIFLRKRGDFLARYFVFHVYAVALWVGANAFADLARTPFTNILGAGFAFIGVSFFVSFYLCFVYAFIYKSKPPRLMRVLFFFPAIVFSLGAFSHYSVVDTLFPPGLPSQIIPGVFYTYHLIFFIVSLLYSLFLLIRFWVTKANAQERLQAIFMGSGFLIEFAATVFFGIVLPVYFQEYRFFNFGPQFSLFLVLFSSYAILRHRLFDLELLIRKGAVFTALFAIFAFIFNLTVVALAQIVTPTLSTVAAVLLITALFTPLKTWLEKSTDKIFFRHRRRLEESIDLLNGLLSSVHTPESFVETITKFIRDEIKVEKIAFWVIDEQGDLVEQRNRGLQLRPLHVDAENPVLSYVRDLIRQAHNGITVLESDDLAYRIDYEPTSQAELAMFKDIRRFMKKFGYAATVPFVSGGRVVGIVFIGSKLSGDRFIANDFRLLDQIAHEGSLSLENAINAERARRLNELKEEFIRVISHQLRTPLIAAKWTTEIILGKEDISVDVLEAVGDVQVNLVRLNDGLNAMLTVLAIAQGQVKLKKSSVRFAKDILASVIEEFGVQAKKKHQRVVVSAKPKDLSVMIDKEKIRKVIAVLISNAVTYSPDYSQIDVLVTASKTDWQVVVQDVGIGVAKRDRQEIFEKFFRGAEAKKLSPDGLGVNLYIARDFALRHGGRLAVEDRLDGKKGARFVLTLPR